MACILKPECSFSQGYFQCKLPEGMVDVEVKIRTMRGIHTFQRDCTTQIISCKPWSPQQHPYPSLAKKMKTYLELKGQNMDHPSFSPVRLPMSLPHKTSVQNKSREERRSRTTYRSWYKVRMTGKSSSPSHVQPQKREKTNATSTTTNPTMAKQSNPIPLANYKVSSVTTQNTTSEKPQEFPQVQPQEKSASLTTTAREYPHWGWPSHWLPRQRMLLPHQ